MKSCRFHLAQNLWIKIQTIQDSSDVEVEKQLAKYDDIMMLAKPKNSALITPAGHFSSRLTNLYLSPIKILAIMLLVLLKLSTVAVIAETLENEWTAVVIPIMQSPVSAHQNRITTQVELFQKWRNFITTRYPSRRDELAWTPAKSFPLYRTCRGFSCNVMDLSKTHDGKSHHDVNKCGKNHFDKHCGKNQHRKHCSKNQCDKPFDKDRHKKHCAKNRNSDGRHGKNFHKQNKLQKMKNCNKRKKIMVDNKIIVNINKDRTPSPTSLRVKTTVPVLVSNTHKCVEQNSSFGFFEICLLIYCVSFILLWYYNL